MKQENTFERDLTFSLFHRDLPKNYYYIDIDGIMFDRHCRPVAVIEEKKSSNYDIDLNSFQFKCIRNLAGDLPAFLVIVNRHEDYLTFWLEPLNKAGAAKFEPGYLSEKNYAQFEGILRKEAPTTHDLKKLSEKKNTFKLPKLLNRDI